MLAAGRPFFRGALSRPKQKLVGSGSRHRRSTHASQQRKYRFLRSGRRPPSVESSPIVEVSQQRTPVPRGRVLARQIHTGIRGASPASNAHARSKDAETRAAVYPPRHPPIRNSSSRASSRRRAGPSSRRGPSPSTWRARGAHGTSPCPPVRWTSPPAAPTATACGGRPKVGTLGRGASIAKSLCRSGSSSCEQRTQRVH